MERVDILLKVMQGPIKCSNSMDKIRKWFYDSKTPLPWNGLSKNVKKYETTKTSILLTIPTIIFPVLVSARGWENKKYDDAYLLQIKPTSLCF